MWATDPLTAEEEASAYEHDFQDADFPSAQAAKKSAEEATKEDVERPKPYTGATEASTTVHDYARREDLFDFLKELDDRTGEPTPNRQQRAVLEDVAERLIQEAHDYTAQEHVSQVREPLRGLCHGLPGTGKTEVIKWIRELFEHKMCWNHGREFIFVAFQNKMASLINGVTLHGAADMKQGEEFGDRSSATGDVESLFIRSQSLRWIIIDESTVAL